MFFQSLPNPLFTVFRSLTGSTLRALPIPSGSAPHGPPIPLGSALHVLPISSEAARLRSSACFWLFAAAGGSPKTSLRHLLTFWSLVHVLPRVRHQLDKLRQNFIFRSLARACLEVLSGERI